MTVERHSPGGRTADPGYAEMSVTTGMHLVWIAGQCPLDDGRVVGRDDVAAQTRQVIANLRACMRDVGATPDQVVRTTVYVVGDRDALRTAWSVFRDSGVRGRPMAPSTLLGVARLGYGAARRDRRGCAARAPSARVTFRPELARRSVGVAEWDYTALG